MHKPTVLIVDDCEMMRQFLALFLSKKYETTVAESAEEALRLIESGYRPQVVVTDLDLPEMSGAEMTRALRRRMPNTPIIALSGAKESRFRLEVLAAGADDFLAKPFHPAELGFRIFKLLERREQAVLASQKKAEKQPVFGWLWSARRAAAAYFF